MMYYFDVITVKSIKLERVLFDPGAPGVGK